MFPLNLYARVRTSMHNLHTRPWVKRTPGLPCALCFEGGESYLYNSDTSCREPLTHVCFALTLNPEVRRYGGVTQAPLNPEHHDASRNRFAR